MIDAESILHEFDQLKGKRGTWESHWREVAERVIPRLDAINIRREEGGQKRGQNIFDSTAPLALERFAAIMESMLTPRAQQWHKLRSSNDELNKEPEARQWFEDSTKALFSMRYSPKANYASQQHESYMGLGAFGTGAMFIDESLGRPRYRAIHINEIFVAENHEGVIDTVFRRFDYTGRQAAQAFGEKNLPDQMLTSTSEHKDFEFIHCVKPKDSYDPERLDHEGMPFLSAYLAIEGKQIVKVGGFRQQAYNVSRYVNGPKEVYGRSPAMLALADIKMVNEMYKTTLRAGHMQARPMILMHDDGVIGSGGRTINVTPGAVVPGGVSSDGRARVLPFSGGGNTGISLEMMDRKREAIQDAFLITLFQILVEHPQMTATEVLMRAQEKGALLSPTMGRQQSENLGPQIEREMDIGIRNGWIPEPPDVILEAGAEYEIEYTSPLSRAQRTEELVGIQQTIEMAAPFAQVDGRVMDIFDAEECIRISQEITGAPVRTLRSKDALAKLRAKQAEDDEDQRMAEQAPQVAGALKDAAQAGEIIGP